MIGSSSFSANISPIHPPNALEKMYRARNSLAMLYLLKDSIPIASAQTWHGLKMKIRVY